MQGRNGGGEVGEGTRGDCREDLGFSPREMGALEGCGAEEGRTGLRCSRVPSGVIVGSRPGARVGGPRVEAAALVQVIHHGAGPGWRPWTW